VDPIIVLVLAAIVVAAIVGYVVVRRRRAPEARPASPPAAAPEAPPRPAPRLRERLAGSRTAIGDRLTRIFGRDGIDTEFWAELEDGLVASDLGVAASSELVDRVRRRSPTDADGARAALDEELRDLLAGKDRELSRSATPSVILVVGVNGTGKTTSIAKLAAMLQRAGHRVLLGAADTFRAAADEQLRLWADRVGVEVVGGQAGADPAAVAFDAYQSAKARGHDTLIVDTAGRLQNKANLMDELSKIARVLRREAGEIDEVLLVLDATTGQNALSQATTFTAAVGVSGIVLTKLDGTARGGVVVAVEEELGIPVKYVGLGEGLDDLVPFEPAAFVDALLGP
jgi:fused signal recognition particle receptor